MQLRQNMYQYGVLKVNSLTTPVISIGNLVLGGTGKTPVVKLVCTLLRDNGFHPAIISRGYGGTANLPTNVVSDGKTIFLSPKQAGDEPYLLADSLKGTPVLTGKKRIFPCQHAISEFACDALILDDGFQHLSINRNLDIVLFDGSTLVGKNRVFPAGILREPMTALKRCSALLFTGITDENRDSATQFAADLHQRFGKPYYFSSINSVQLHGPKQLSQLTKEERTGFFAFCGIANPDRFIQLLDSIDLHPKRFIKLPDHVHYDQALLDEIGKEAEKCGAKYLITTQKDYVKVKEYDCCAPLFVAEISLSIDNDFKTLILSSIRKHHQ